MQQFRHFYLYAKNHYKRTDTISDLKHILAHECALDERYVDIRDIFELLLRLVSHHIQGEFQFADLVMRLMGNLRIPILCPQNDTERLNYLLSFLANTKVVKENGEIIMELGKADPKVLPLNKRD